MNENNETPAADKREDGDGLPPALHAALRSMYASPGAFPSARDAGILARAKQTRTQGRTRRWIIPGAVAAAIAIAVGVIGMMQLAHHPAAPAAYVRTGDIRDAFYVQRQLDQHHLIPAAFDENHDGVVDAADVRLLAMAAVRIDHRAGTGVPR